MGSARGKGGRGRRDLAGKSLEVPGAAAFALAKNLYRVGDYQFDQGKEQVILERYADTADGALAASGFVLAERDASDESFLVLVDHSEGEPFILLRPFPAADEREAAFLPESGEIKRRLIDVTGGLPLLKGTERSYRRLQKRVYREGDEIGMLTFDEALDGVDGDRLFRVEVVELPEAAVDDLSTLSSLLESRMRQVVEPGLFDFAPAADGIRPESTAVPIELPPLPALGKDESLGARSLEVSLLFAERAMALLDSGRPAFEAECVGIARTALIGARFALELGFSSVGGPSRRTFEKGLHRLASLLGAVAVADLCLARFGNRGAAGSSRSPAFVEHVRGLRGRSVGDLLRHLDGERYRRFAGSYRELKEGEPPDESLDLSIADAAPRILGECSGAVFLGFRRAMEDGAGALDLREALAAARKLSFALELFSAALGKGAQYCASRLALPVAELTRFGEALAAADIARSWLSGGSGIRIDAAAAAFLARSQAEAARVIARRRAILSRVDKVRFRRELALSSYGLG